MAVITISRGSMSGGEALATALSEKLGWPTISREVITQAAEAHGVSEKLVAKQLTEGPGWFKRYTVERRLYINAVESALIQRALEGSYIYHGYAGHLLLKGLPGVLKVRLIAPLEYRVRNLMERKGLTREQSVSYIQQVDKERAAWTQFLYNVDWSDPANYDLVVNLLSLSIESAADLVCRVVSEPEFSDSPAVRQAFEQANLACRIKTRLVQHESTRGMNLNVTVRDKRVLVTGGVVTSGLTHARFDVLKHEIVDIVRSVAQVEGVDIEVDVTAVPVE